MKLHKHPQSARLIREWDHGKNLERFEDVGTGHGKVWWVCENSHSYTMEVYNKIKGQQCRYCRRPGIAVHRNESSLASYPEFSEFFCSSNRVTLDSISVDYTPPLNWRCRLEHEWKSTLKTQIKRNFGCPYCTNEKHLAGYNSLPQTHPEILKEWDPANTVDLQSVFYKDQRSFKWICRDCSHRFTARVSRRAKAETKCPACIGNAIIQGKTDLPSFAPELVKDFDELSTGRPATAVSKSHTVSWFCDKGHSYKASVANKLKGYGFCSICRPSLGSSKPEREVLAFVQELLPSYHVVHRSRSVISPYELDIYVPELKKAIEFNGDYWHSDAYRIPAGLTPADEYHKMKYDRCKAVGVDLSYIWDSEWPTDREKAQVVVMSALGMAHLIEWAQIEC